MASLKQIRAAVKAVVEAAVPGIHVYAAVPASAAILPCVVVQPSPSETADFIIAMGRGTDTWTLDLHVLVESGDDEVAQAALDEYVTGAGDSSLREAIFGNRTLGLVSTDAHVSGCSGYGFKFESAGYPHLGATLRLTVHTSGTS